MELLILPHSHHPLSSPLCFPKIKSRTERHGNESTISVMLLITITIKNYAPFLQKPLKKQQPKENGHLSSMFRKDKSSGTAVKCSFTSIGTL